LELQANGVQARRPCRLTIDIPFEMVRCQTNLKGTSWTDPAAN
jgi:hypothetical protein